jgi:hypothetical protein
VAVICIYGSHLTSFPLVDRAGERLLRGGNGMTRISSTL